MKTQGKDFLTAKQRKATDVDIWHKRADGSLVKSNICQVRYINPDNQCKVRIPSSDFVTVNQVKGKRVCRRCFLNNCKPWKLGKVWNTQWDMLTSSSVCLIGVK